MAKSRLTKQKHSYSIATELHRTSGSPTERVVWSALILGEPCSKANSRRAVPRKRKDGKMFMAFIKGDKAQRYAEDFRKQANFVQPNIKPYEGPVEVGIAISYRTRRPDLDESLILDLLQGYAYKNDRQVVGKHIRRLPEDKDNPRAVIVVRRAQ